MATIRNTLLLYDGLHTVFGSAGAFAGLLPGRMENLKTSVGYAFPEVGFRVERGENEYIHDVFREMESGCMSGITSQGMDNRVQGTRNPAANGFFGQDPQEGKDAAIASAGQNPPFRWGRGDFFSQARNINFKAAEPFFKYKINGTFGLLKNKDTALYEALFRKALDSVYGPTRAMIWGRIRESAPWPMMESAPAPVWGNNLVNHMGGRNKMPSAVESAPEEALLSFWNHMKLWKEERKPSSMSAENAVYPHGTLGMAPLIYPRFIAKRLNAARTALVDEHAPTGWDRTHGRSDPAIEARAGRFGEGIFELPHGFAVLQDAAQSAGEDPGGPYPAPGRGGMRTEFSEHPSGLNGTAEMGGFLRIRSDLGKAPVYESNEWMEQFLSDDLGGLKMQGGQFPPERDDPYNLFTGAFKPDLNRQSSPDGGGWLSLSPDDLKILRELSETGSNQNFVSLTPTVQVTTGDIHNDVDVNDIVTKIERALTVEIAASSAAALGVSG